jgi:hypothetical protein
MPACNIKATCNIKENQLLSMGIKETYNAITGTGGALRAPQLFYQMRCTGKKAAPRLG